MAEWLGRGLQNLLQRFESAWYLRKKAPDEGSLFLLTAPEGATIYIKLKKIVVQFILVLLFLFLGYLQELDFAIEYFY